MALRQSLRLTQPWPLVQRGQSEPPQSTPVSLAFLTPSLQLGDAQVPSWQVPPGQIAPPGRFALHLPFLRFLQGGQGFFFLASAAETPSARASRPPATDLRGRDAVKRSN